MLNRVIALFAVALCALMPAYALGQDATGTGPLLQKRGEDIAKVLMREVDSEEVFSERFRSAVPDTRLLGLIEQLAAQFGPLQGLQSVEPTGPASARITLRFRTGLAIGEFAINPKAPYLVEGLNLREFQPLGDSPDKIVADLAMLPGETGMLLVRLDDGEVLASHQPDKLFAIGSTFKLYVLGAIGRDVAQGALDWQQIVPLSRKSFPSGMLQDWPQGAPITVQSLASLMISISDNTATDQLIDLAGREEVEAEVRLSGHDDPAATFPFLLTSELFALKAGESGPAYLAADEAGRRAILNGLDPLSLDLEIIERTFSGDPILLDIEWLASPSDLVSLLRHLRDMDDPTVLDVIAISPGIAPDTARQFSYIGYKGGSEPGVLNQTWLLQTQDGAWYALTVSWNDTDARLERTSLMVIARRAMGLLLPEAERPDEGNQ